MDTPKADRISRQEQAQQTRQRLFDAAYSLLQEKDFKDITINEIVSRAGGRARNLLSVLRIQAGCLLSNICPFRRLFPRGSSAACERRQHAGAAAALFFSYAYYNAVHSNIKLTRLLYNGENRNFLRQCAGMYTILHDIVSYGLAAGELDRALTADAHCSLLMDLARGLVYRWCISDAAFPPDTLRSHRQAVSCHPRTVRRICRLKWRKARNRTVPRLSHFQSQCQIR